MKKILALLAIVSILLSLTSCSVPVSERTLVAEYKLEHPMWANAQPLRFDDWFAPRQFSVEFMGNTYQGTYAYSERYHMYSRYPLYHVNYYSFNNGEDEFGVQADTGRLLYLHFPKDEKDPVPAHEIVEKYIDVDKTVASFLNSFTDRYTYLLDGVPTGEYVDIIDGTTFGGFETNMIGAFDSLKDDPETSEVIARLQSDEAVRLVNSLIDERYPNISTIPKIRETRLTLVGRNELAMIYEVEFPSLPNKYDGFITVEEIVVSLQ